MTRSSKAQGGGIFFNISKFHLHTQKIPSYFFFFIKNFLCELKFLHFYLFFMYFLYLTDFSVSCYFFIKKNVITGIFKANFSLHLIVIYLHKIKKRILEEFSRMKEKFWNTKGVKMTHWCLYLNASLVPIQSYAIKNSYWLIIIYIN